MLARRMAGTGRVMLAVLVIVLAAAMATGSPALVTGTVGLWMVLAWMALTHAG